LQTELTDIASRAREKEGRPNAEKTIIILGAGYAGLFLSLNLESYIGTRNDDCRIVLIDKNSYHQLLQEIHFVAAGARTEEQVKIPIPAMLYGKKIQFIQATVSQIQLEEHRVVYNDANESQDCIAYDYLVIALGASTRYFDIPGAEEF
jgi:NADH:ubiquinone reductase (H+-translocating)